MCNCSMSWGNPILITQLHGESLKEWFGEKIDLSKTEKSNSAPQT